MTNIKEVARQAGVSASTVSRVLNAKGYVNEATRQKVLQAVQQTGYRPNVLAKSLKSGRSNTICLMVPSMQNPIFSRDGAGRGGRGAPQRVHGGALQHQRGRHGGKGVHR
ncbi:LacI family DNA-binding transcriptional regulator [Ruthenibacterium sp. CLA-JM-H11]|uniref:LacI family DNA-binding transcriptional regulator n=1 Tax=Ruthenibacterium intestinale TaxID=3133163 RepID=A0ABV1GD19_9FIRM